MKNILNKLPFLLGILLMVSCSDYNEIPQYNGESIASFTGRSPITLLAKEGEDNTIEVEVGATSTASVDRTYKVERDPRSTASADQYSFPSTVTIPANEYIGYLEVTPNFEKASTTGTTLILKLTSMDPGAVTGFSDTFTINIFKYCPSNLNVAFTWEASGPQLSKTLTGSDKLVRVAGSDTRYVFESGFFDFGYYCLNYNAGANPGCGDGAKGSLRLNDTCGKLSYVGADQWGDSFTISNVIVDGSKLTYTWESDYGESSTVTLTRTDGENWPSNLK